MSDEGVLILGSGNVVHNLRAIDWQSQEQGFDWAQRFDDDAREILMKDPSALGQLVGSDDFRLAVPTPDHFLPLAYLAGLASVSATIPNTFAEGCTMGSLSMTSYAI